MANITNEATVTETEKSDYTIATADNVVIAQVSHTSIF